MLFQCTGLLTTGPQRVCLCEPLLGALLSILGYCAPTVDILNFPFLDSCTQTPQSHGFRARATLSKPPWQTALGYLCQLQLGADKSNQRLKTPAAKAESSHSQLLISGHHNHTFPEHKPPEPKAAKAALGCLCEPPLGTHDFNQGRKAATTGTPPSLATDLWTLQLRLSSMQAY